MPLRLLARLLVALVLLPIAPAHAAEAGLQRLNVFTATADSAPIPLGLYYPTQAPARAIAMGPFTAQVAINGPAEATVKALIVLSHGTGGSELGHSSLAESLARHGYLVAALRHPGDNWQDRSLLQRERGGYFSERPLQASRIIDAILDHPDWRHRIPSDSRGPKVGAVGHSAGGYTVLALAGGQPDLSQLIRHCRQFRAEDPIFCGVGATTATDIDTPLGSAPSLRDPRIRAVVALAPVGVVLTARSLAAIDIPTLVYIAEKDSFLVPRFPGHLIQQNAPQLEFRRGPGAGHFAFMDTPGMPVETEDGDARANPPGFDRAAFLQDLQRALPEFFDKVFQ